MTFSEDTKKLTIEHYLQKSKPNPHGMINNFKISIEGKVQLLYKIENMSSKDTNGKREIYITSFTLAIMIGEDTEETIK